MLDLDQFEALSQDMTLSKEASNPKGLNSNWWLLEPELSNEFNNSHLYTESKV